MMLFNTSKKFLPLPVKIFLRTKSDLRKTLKADLASISDLEYRELCLKVSDNLKSLLNRLSVIQAHSVIGVFAPILKEPLWYLSLEQELKEKKIMTAYPAYARDLMIYRLAQMGELRVSQDFGVDILGPALEASEVTPEIIIVPGLGFTKSGKRLGRGKGFYDRYLEKNSVIKIGIAFESQVLEDLPVDAHDVLMDFVVTDQQIYNTKSLG